MGELLKIKGKYVNGHTLEIGDYTARMPKVVSVQMKDETVRIQYGDHMERFASTGAMELGKENVRVIFEEVRNYLRVWGKL